MAQLHGCKNEVTYSFMHIYAEHYQFLIRGQIKINRLNLIELASWALFCIKCPHTIFNCNLNFSPG